MSASLLLVCGIFVLESYLKIYQGERRRRKRGREREREIGS